MYTRRFSTFYHFSFLRLFFCKHLSIFSDLVHLVKILSSVIWDKGFCTTSSIPASLHFVFSFSSTCKPVTAIIRGVFGVCVVRLYGRVQEEEREARRGVWRVGREVKEWEREEEGRGEKEKAERMERAVSQPSMGDMTKSKRTTSYLFFCSISIARAPECATSHL